MSEIKSPESSAVNDISVRTLLIPLSGMTLVLPNTAVAEVTDYQVPQPVAANAPAWVLGIMGWRGRSIPLLAFEQLLGRPAGVGGVHARAVICNTLNRNRELPFIAILAQGIPRLLELKGDMVEPADSEVAVSAGVAARVKLAGLSAIIPDLDMLERMLVRLGVKTS